MMSVGDQGTGFRGEWDKIPFWLTSPALRAAAVGLWCTVNDSLIAEALARLGPEYVCIDMQHGAADFGNLVPLVQGVSCGGSVPLVRVPDSQASGIMAALDAGAAGVIVPLVETAKEAESVVSACRYPPRGRRSYGAYRASISRGTRSAGELENVAAIVMVETALGLANVGEIATVEGVSGIYVGPSDLSLGLGMSPPALSRPEFKVAVEKIRSACDRAGVVAGIHAYDGETARRFISEGFSMVTVAVDLRTLMVSLKMELEESRRVESLP